MAARPPVDSALDNNPEYLLRIEGSLSAYR